MFFLLSLGLNPQNAKPKHGWWLGLGLALWGSARDYSSAGSSGF